MFLDHAVLWFKFLRFIVALLREGIHGDGGAGWLPSKRQGDISLLEIVGGPYSG